MQCGGWGLTSHVRRGRRGSEDKLEQSALRAAWAGRLSAAEVKHSQCMAVPTAMQLAQRAHREEARQRHAALSAKSEQELQLLRDGLAREQGHRRSRADTRHVHRLRSPSTGQTALPQREPTASVRPRSAEELQHLSREAAVELKQLGDLTQARAEGLLRRHRPGRTPRPQSAR